MSKIMLLCGTVTPFTQSGDLDEEGLRQLLQRLVDAGHGAYLASGVGGEGHSLTKDELSRVYRIGVEVCGDKVPACAQQAQVPTIREALALIEVAVAAEVDHVNVFGPFIPGYIPTDVEYLDYLDQLLKETKHPMGLSANSIVGYSPKPSLVAAVCNKYPQITTVRLSGTAGDTYFIDLKNNLKRDVDIYVSVAGSLNMFEMGATGLVDPGPQIFPDTYRQYIDHYEARNFDELSRAYVQIRRVTQYVSQWKGGNPRWIKMALNVLNLPGGTALREPYLMPDDAERQRFLRGLLDLNVPEINALAQAAGAGK